MCNEKKSKIKSNQATIEQQNWAIWAKYEIKSGEGVIIEAKGQVKPKNRTLFVYRPPSGVVFVHLRHGVELAIVENI